jgi:DNA-binding GntR family transcriptional regulator
MLLAKREIRVHVYVYTKKMELRKMVLVDALRQEILAGRLPPGTLLSQTDIAARFGVSRIPVRDALQQLSSERLVIVLPGKGAQVVELTTGELAEIYDIRMLLECDLLRRAVERACPEDHAEAEYALRKARLEAGRPGWMEGDWLFHVTLYTPAGRKKQLSMVDELRLICVIHAAQYERLAEETTQWLDHHDCIFRAFVNGDADSSVGYLKGHLEAARSFLLGLSDVPQEQVQRE